LGFHALASQIHLILVAEYSFRIFSTLGCHSLVPAPEYVFVSLVAGNSVCVYVHGFEPYFYIPLPQGYNPDDREIYIREMDVRYPTQKLIVSVQAEFNLCVEER
jgi:hypothetical protein